MAFEIEVVENTVLATFQTAINARLAAAAILTGPMIITDDFAGTRTYSQMMQIDKES